MSSYIIEGGKKLEGETYVSGSKNAGCKVKCNKNKVVIDSSNVNSFEIPEGLMREMRSSVIFAGSIVGRYKKAIFSYPGDCDTWWIHQTNTR